MINHRIPKAFAFAALTLLAGCDRQADPAAGSAARRPSPQELSAIRARFDSTPSMQPRLAVVSALRVSGVRQTAADALARIGEEAVPPLIEALAHPEAEVREEAARAFARMGVRGREAIPALIVALNDEHKAVRQAAARALGQMGPAANEAVPALIDALKDPANRAEPLEFEQ